MWFTVVGEAQYDYEGGTIVVTHFEAKDIAEAKARALDVLREQFGHYQPDEWEVHALYRGRQKNLVEGNERVAVRRL